MEKTAPSKKNKKSGLLVTVIILVLIVFWNNFTLKINKQTITSDKISEQMTVVVMSDLHYSGVGVGKNKILKSVKKQKPDLICVLGDMYSYNSSVETIVKTVDFCSKLTENGCPVLFVPGEHDREDFYYDSLRAAGIKVFINASETITVGKNTIDVYGISKAYFSPEFTLYKYFARPDGENLSLFLAHIPMYNYYSEFGADLTLCGDTHGGVINLPFIGPVNYNGLWFPELFNKDENITDKGFFNYKGGTMFVTSGLGNYVGSTGNTDVDFPMRFNNRPEIAVIKIKPR